MTNEKLLKKLTRKRNTLSNHSGRGYTNCAYSSMTLIDSYHELADEAKERGIWEDWCDSVGSDPHHNGHDFFA